MMTSAPTIRLPEGFQPDRATLLVDADEVLLRFVEHLEAYCSKQGYDLHLKNFQLSGNIFARNTGLPASAEDVKNLIAAYFDACVDTVPAVPGAQEGLLELSRIYQIAILTNVPAHCRERRAKNLQQLGIDFPVIANTGPKGPVVRALASQTTAPVVFVDDLPPQHASVAKEAPATHRVHFIADERLQKLIGKAEHAHIRIDRWQELTSYLQSHLHP